MQETPLDQTTDNFEHVYSVTGGVNEGNHPRMFDEELFPHDHDVASLLEDNMGDSHDDLMTMFEDGHNRAA